MRKSVRTARWNAELNTDVCDAYNNADLTITLRLGFRQINPPGGAREGTYNDYGDPTRTARKIVKWPAGEWVAWTHNLASSAQRYWNGKFWILNTFPLLEFKQAGITYRPNFWCKLRIVSVLAHGAAPVAAHHVIDVVRLHPTENWFGSHSTLYDNLDTVAVPKGRDSAGRPIMQQAHVHEVGHLLGLGHVDEGKAHCPVTGDTNARACYGVADADKNAVMGAGMQLRKPFANPWRRAVVQLTGKGHAGAPTDWIPSFQRHYPRTAEDIRTGRNVIARPVRPGGPVARGDHDVALW
jgi:hypothetical protein